MTRFKVGDSVFVRLPEESRGKFTRDACRAGDSMLIRPGAWSEYAKCAERFVALKPESLSFSDAASLPLAAMTALQALRKYKGSLAGKTVFIPAGCRLDHICS